MNRDGNTQQSNRTPPAGFTNVPLTPPQTGEESADQTSSVLHEIRSRLRTRCPHDEAWLKFDLSFAEFTALESKLENEIEAGYKLRYDYFRQPGQFVLRMESATHAQFAVAVVDRIAQQLGEIAQGHSPSARFAGDVKKGGSTTLLFDDPEYGQHSPDMSFHHSNAQYAGVVIEVAYSQKAREFPRLAEDYILGSDGNIQVVIGFNIEYPQEANKTATISIWKPQLHPNEGGVELAVEQTVADQVFRNHDGTPSDDPETGLRLSLEDFAPEAVTKQFDDLSGSIFISSRDLCRYLDDAKRREIFVKEKKGMVNPKTVPMTKRKRVSTPPDELDEVREQRIRDEEDRVSERCARDDLS